MKVGDIVILNGSKEPHMTVIRIDNESQTAICRWFDLQHQIHESAFPLAVLKAA